MNFDLMWLRELAHQTSPLFAFAGLFVGFAGMYLGLALGTLFLTKRVFPTLGIGQPIDPRPIRPGQLRGELVRSLVSVSIFAGYGMLTLWAERHGLVTIRWQETTYAFLLDLVGFFLWNEVHFYVCHRLLHTRWLMRNIHVWHHRSVVPTPFSTYSFHGVEALLLSSVMLIWLLILPLGIGTVLVFPLVSLVINCVGHMNYAVFPQAGLDQVFAGCRRHTMHHTEGGNYGFYLPWLDAWFHTRQR